MSETVCVCATGQVGEPLHHRSRNDGICKYISGKPKRHSIFIPKTRHSTAIASGLSLRFYLIAEIVASPGFKKKLIHTHTWVKHITKIPFLRKRCLYNFFHNATEHCNIFLWPHISLPSYTQCWVSSKHSRNSKADMSFDTVEVVASFHGFLLWLSAFHQEEKINKIKYTRIALPANWVKWGGASLRKPN